MFRTKKKKVGGRKRREVEAENENEGADVSADASASFTTEIPPSIDAVEAASGLQVLEELRRSRSRPNKSAMTFSSKTTSARSSASNTQAAVAGSVHSEASGLLSFDDGERQTKQKKRKMRPNLVVSSTVDVEMEETTGQYSAEMLASLRSEQSVLLPNKREETPVDIEMLDVESGNDEEVKEIIVEEEEEFISLDGDNKTRRSKSRMTFGEHSDGLDISKTTEVVEEVATEEDDEQNRRWEEELMRRGGHRVPPTSESKGRRSRDGLPTYPTRRKVACVSLGSVLGKLEKNLESTTFEDERASRELARLEAETALVETTLKQQEEELLISSEEFEYFQDIEDFVKGLSFCLREKVPVIQVKETKIIDERVQRVKATQQKEKQVFAEDVKRFLDSGVLQQSDIFGLSHLDLLSRADMASSNDTHVARMLKYQQHFTESYVADTQQVDEDLFADAIDEINSLERVYGRFQEWKAKFPEVYKNTYCELAQEKLFAPYVQAELLYWDPLAVADSDTMLKLLEDFAWFRVLHQHVRNSGAVNGPLLYQIRDVLLEKVRIAVSSYFDPYSSLQTRSLSLVLEQINRHGYYTHVEEKLQILVDTTLDAFSSEAKRTVLVAINQHTAESSKDANVFARYLLERFIALQDNLLTLFVALPKGPIAAAGFRCLLQVLHQLLAYVRYCQETHKMQLVATATQVVKQLSGSSYLLQILSEPSQERELKHMMELFTPFLQ
ncbi:hypothetical protein F442_11066 [Phytophthora nicotianae P10297]|uniref:GCF C-terminal domain-containing protein n=1 Tax=Phytophthora nicotianae P10297 TaxID=1317064 RepID=W2Z6Z1_PHYNI|nr:hypothetical protein F442_11066 [Phytophthora nicotianae P10297]